MALSDEDFMMELNNIVAHSNNSLSHSPTYRLVPSVCELANKRLSFPLSTLQASLYTSQRLALIGDAAHSIHPMAGLGVNAGISDSAFLANNIILNKKAGNDIGERIALSKFESQSKALNYSNSIAMECLKKSF